MHGGRFSLIQTFARFAMLGAEWVMWVLVALSVASVAVMLERGRYYYSLREDLEKLADDLRQMLRDGDRAGATKRLEASPSPAAAIALAGLREADAGHKSAEEAMLGATARVRLSLERYLAFLGTVGNNAPFVGLFGTVIGIIQAFDALRVSETAARAAARAAATGGTAPAAGFDTGMVMGTLAEALVATAIGLLVAIPAVAAFNYFQRKVRSIVSSGETLSHVVLAALAAEPQGAHAAPSKPEPAKAEPSKETRNRKDKSDKDKSDKSDKSDKPEAEAKD